VQLNHNLKGISKLAFLLFLIVFFLLGTIVSYIWTMGFYAPGEFNLPKQTSLTIENVVFPPDSAVYFNVTMLNPSYSPSDAIIDRIKVVTEDGKVHFIASASPSLPLKLAPGTSQILKTFWNWANYTGQTVDVYIIIVGGSGPAVQTKTASMNLAVASIVFEPSITASRFNVTVESMGSPVSVDLNKITVNGAEVTDVTPTLPYQLNPNASVTFTINRNWANLQNTTVSVGVQTKQGFAAYRSASAPQVKLDFVGEITFFNTTATSFFFNATIHNSATPPTKVDISLITVYVEGQNITIETVSPILPHSLESNATLLLTCTWDWNTFKGKNATVTVYTVQGFKSSTETIVQSTP